MHEGKNRLELNDDGSPRRKYEIPQEPAARSPMLAAIALVLGGAFAVMKDALFGKADPAQPQSDAGDMTNARSEPAVDLQPVDIAFPELPQEGIEPVQEGDAPHLRPLSIAGARIKFTDAGAVPILELPNVGNDNERLYEALPEPPVRLAVPMSGASGGGGSASGGGGSGPAAGGDADPGNEGGADGDEGEDDDDGDPTAGGGNRAPVLTGNVALGGLMMNQVLAIGLADLLRTASDPDGDELAVVALEASSGRLERTADGWHFTPGHNDTGDVTFTYMVSDGSHMVAAEAMLDLLARPPWIIEGTGGDDRLIGTDGSDVIVSLGGDDTVAALDGDDQIHGGDGNDRIVAGDGRDVVHAGSGNDVVLSGSGNDVVFGGSGDDVILGEAGNDTLHGEDGNDTISGGRGDDVIAGGSGGDALDGAAGADVIDAGGGDDIIMATAGDGDDVIDGGGGQDALDLSATTAGAVIDLAAGTAQSSDIGADAITSIEVVIAGGGNDTLTGGSSADDLSGGSGDDTIAGQAGCDTISGGAGDDVIVATAGDGDDVIDGGGGRDTFDLSATTADAVIDLAAGTAQSSDIGCDVIASIEVVIGGSGDDTIIVDDQPNVLAGGAGADVFVFHSTSAIGLGHGSRDRILDFDVGDRIDLEKISEEFADVISDVFQLEDIRRFVLIDDQSAFDRPGQLKILFAKSGDDDVTIIQGSIDHDGDAEFELEIVGHYRFSDHDFYRHD